MGVPCTVYSAHSPTPAGFRFDQSIISIRQKSHKFTTDQYYCDIPFPAKTSVAVASCTAFVLLRAVQCAICNIHIIHALPKSISEPKFKRSTRQCHLQCMQLQRYTKSGICSKPTNGTRQILVRDGIRSNSADCGLRTALEGSLGEQTPRAFGSVPHGRALHWYRLQAAYLMQWVK